VAAAFSSCTLQTPRRETALTLLVPYTTVFRLIYPRDFCSQLSMHGLENEQSREYFQRQPPPAPRADSPAAWGEASWVGLVSLLITGSLMTWVYS